MSPKFRYFLPAIGWIIFSTILLTIPGKDLPEASWLDAIYFDKWVHIGMFSIMVTLLCWGFYKTSNKQPNYLGWFVFFCLLCIGYGIGMEYVQKNFIPRRSFDVNDIIADSVGSVVGVVFSWWRYIKK